MLTAVAAGINCRLLATPQRQLAERETKPRLATPQRRLATPQRQLAERETKNSAEKKETKNKTLQRRGGHIGHKIPDRQEENTEAAQFSE